MRCIECTPARKCFTCMLSHIEAVVAPAVDEGVDLLTTINDLHEALRSLVDVLDRQGGWLSSEDQAALWRARRLVR